MNTQVKALIIDDDKDICELLSLKLKRNNIHVSSANSLAQGYDCLIDVNPHIIFLDNSLPDGTGIEFIKIIQKYDPSIKIIMITGDTINNLENIAHDRGAWQFIKKPLTSELIDKTVAMISKTFIAAFIPLLSFFSAFSD